jgi:hypothetical protein
MIAPAFRTIRLSGHAPRLLRLATIRLSPLPSPHAIPLLYGVGQRLFFVDVLIHASHRAGRPMKSPETLFQGSTDAAI